MNKSVTHIKLMYENKHLYGNMVCPVNATEEGTGVGWIKSTSFSLLMLLFTFTFPTSVLAKAENVETFGHCQVGTSIDDFSDEKTFFFDCKGEGDGLGKYIVIMSCSDRLHVVSITAGIQFHIEDTIEVLYRFDKGELHEEQWPIYNNNLVVRGGKDIYNKFTDNIKKSKKLIFKVGDNKGSIDLTGSVGAVDEHKRRCATLRN